MSVHQPRFLHAFALHGTCQDEEHMPNCSTVLRNLPSPFSTTPGVANTSRRKVLSNTCPLHHVREATIGGIGVPMVLLQSFPPSGAILGGCLEIELVPSFHRDGRHVHRLTNTISVAGPRGKITFRKETELE